MLKWWHGTGGLLDYTNKDAVDWWHKQLDNVNMRTICINESHYTIATYNILYVFLYIHT